MLSLLFWLIHRRCCRIEGNRRMKFVEGKVATKPCWGLDRKCSRNTKELKDANAIHAEWNDSANISGGAARGSGSANSGGSARFSRQRKRKGKRRHEKWRQRKRKGKRYHEKRRQRKRKGKRRDYRCPEGSDNYRCRGPNLYFLLSYFVTFFLTSLHSSDLVLQTESSVGLQPALVSIYPT